MKVLLDHDTPFRLAHGGFQIQIQRTKEALESAGVEVDYLRWWDDQQSGDLIHYFGRPLAAYIELAHARKLPVVVGELLSGLGARSAFQRAVQRRVIRLARCVVPPSLTVRLAWDTYRLADALVAVTPWEAQLMVQMFEAPADRVHVVPNGVEAIFLDGPTKVPRGPWLICTATITEVKRVVELAEAAVAAQVPLWVLGKPYGGGEGYAARFLKLARDNSKWIRYEGPVEDRGQLAQIYREARGFVLLSAWESLSLSALEAAACGCPLLLSDLPWARTTFGTQASYCPAGRSREKWVRALGRFYSMAHELSPPARPKSWNEVALLLKALYEGCLATA